MRSRPLRAVPGWAVRRSLWLLWIYADATPGWIAIIVGCIWWFVAFAWLRHFSWAAAPTRENIAIKLFAGALTILPAWTAMMQLHRNQGSPHTWAPFTLWCWSGRPIPSPILAGDAGARSSSPRTSVRQDHCRRLRRVCRIGAGGIDRAAGCWLCAAQVWQGCWCLPWFVVLFSVIGDLFESLIKRHGNVKDSGTLFPGHGPVFVTGWTAFFAALPFFAVGKFLLGL